jgi:ribosomal protein L7/L12
MIDEASFEAELRSLLENGRKIEAIKLFRERTGAGLAQAKEAVEAFERGETLAAKVPADSDLEREIVPLLEQGKKIEAVKLYREKAGAGLKEAKDAVEALAAERHITVPLRSGCLGVVLFILAVLLAGFALADGPPAKVTAVESLGLTPLVHSPDLFPILPWDPLHDWKRPYRTPKHGLESIADCGFTMAGFVKPEDLPLCEKLGLAAIMAPVESEEPWFGQWRKLSDRQIDEQVEEMVKKTAHSKPVLGYFIMDEPGAPAFPALAKVVAAVKKYAPGKLAYINLFPSYATVGAPDKSQLGTASYTEYLERFVKEVKPQVISYDNYMVQYSDDLQEERTTAIYYADLLEIRRVGQKYGLPFWNIVSCNQIRKEVTIPSPANLAFQAYTTLAAGGRGVSWYQYYQGGYAYAPIGGDGNKTETWQYLQVVNRQVRTLGPIMNRLWSTGVFFSSPPPVKSLPLLPGRIIKQVESKASPRGITKAQPPVMVGEFTDEQGRDFVMVVNLSLEKSTNIKLATSKPYKSKQVYSAADGRLLPLDEKNGHWVLPGHGLLVKLE